MVEILSKDKYKEYTEFLENSENSSFTQSLNWTKVKKGWGYEVVVARDENKKIIGGMLILIKTIPVCKLSLLYSPRGMVCDYHNKQILKELLNGALKVAKKHHGYLFKIDPYILASDDEAINNLKELGFEFTPGLKHGQTIQTRHNYMLCNLKGKTEDEVFMSIGAKSRNCIRGAIKKGVECKQYPVSNIDKFYEIYNMTGNRNGFSIRPKEYLKGFVEAFGDNGAMFICTYEGEPVCGGILAYCAGRCCHVYGATSDKHRQLNANYLMQWEMMKWGLAKGCDIYDMQGITITPEEDEHLYGVYQFKKSFKCGEVVEYAGEFDYVISPMLNKFATHAQNALMKYNRIRNKRK